MRMMGGKHQKKYLNVPCTNNEKLFELSLVALASAMKSFTCTLTGFHLFSSSLAHVLLHRYAADNLDYQSKFGVFLLGQVNFCPIFHGIAKLRMCFRCFSTCAMKARKCHIATALGVLAL